MKYTYAYKTPDGTRHEASIEAPSRDVAFAVLRSQGIRPIKVVAADGSKENGEERGGKVKGWSIAAGLLLISFALFVFFVAKKQPAPEFQADQTRRYPIGDAAIIEKGILTGWSDVFEHEGDRFLASFAVPGVRAAQRNTTVEEIKSALGRSVSIANDDGLEARQIKAMVEGMKAEARAYVAAGGSVVEYGKRLTERQDAEIAAYERTKADLERAKETMRGNALINYWESQNDKLRNLGIRPLTLESLE
jgi:hypothetical protein